jgi:hypothetical protein
MGNTKTSFSIVAFGFCAFIVAFSLGSLLTFTTGIPLLGGLINGVFVSMILTIGMLSIRRFGTATWMWLVFSICCIPFTTLGPPGVYKVVIGLIAGFIWDIVYFVTKKSRFGLFLGAILGAASIMFLIIIALKSGFVANVQAALEKYINAIYALVLINISVTFIGVLIGNQTYNTRLSKIQLFKDLGPK